MQKDEKSKLIIVKQIEKSTKFRDRKFQSL